MGQFQITILVVGELERIFNSYYQISILGFHVTPEIKLKILSFYLYQVKAILKFISVGLSSAR